MGLQTMTIYAKDGTLLWKTDDGPFEGQDLRGGCFVGMELEGANFYGCDLREADFTGADLYWAVLMAANCDDTTFARADLRNAALTESSFRRADLRGADFGLDNLLASTDVCGIDFTDANLDEANFTGALYDSATLFPEGFDPSQRGMQRKPVGPIESDQRLLG